MSDIFVTSDDHFGHPAIIDYADRPFADVPEMNETLIENWNRVVGPKDIVFHLGDVGMGLISEALECVKRLNGIKVLVRGNHDRMFEGRRQSMTRRYWVRQYMDAGFGVVENSHTFANGLAVMSHFPYDGDSHDRDRYKDYRLPDNGVPLIHGHIHSKNVVSRSKAGTLQVHIGVDAWDFTPVPLDTVFDIIRDHR